MTSTILCCGEALIDMLPGRTDDGSACFVPRTGGAVFNTAIGLGRLGVDAGMVTGLSTDLFGRMLSDALGEAGVDTDRVILSDRPTTLAFVDLQDGHAQYHFYDENSAGRCLTASDMPDLPDAAAALFLGGISLAVEPCADAYAGLAAQAGDRLVMLDPNVRPQFIADNAAYRARLMRMLARADVVKVSDEDLRWLWPQAGDEAAQLQALQATGTSLVILTRGAQGAVAYRAGLPPLEVPVRPATVVDTVGAGDSFNAGFLAQLARSGYLSRSALSQITNAQLAEALTFAARVAAVTVSREGADPPTLADLSE